MGDTTAKYLAHLQELGNIKQKAIFSLCGLAPKANDSGKWLSFYSRQRKAFGKKDYLHGCPQRYSL
ncbi:MAG: IS110 family transposase [Holosporaceae bacterium]|nr:IS110 family transposase [Holosporaceae bacterium]